MIHITSEGTTCLRIFPSTFDFPFCLRPDIQAVSTSILWTIETFSTLFRSDAPFKLKSKSFIPILLILAQKSISGVIWISLLLLTRILELRSFKEYFFASLKLAWRNNWARFKTWNAWWKLVWNEIHPVWRWLKFVILG